MLQIKPETLYTNVNKAMAKFLLVMLAKRMCLLTLLFKGTI